MDNTGATSMLLVLILMVDTNVSAKPDTMAMVSNAKTKTNVSKMSAIKMQNVVIPWVHFLVPAILDSLVMVFRALT